MKAIRIETQLEEYDHISQLTLADRNLLETARKTALRAYAPYSGFRVGAAILLADGTIVEGTNQENSSYPVGTCAERTALFYASSQYPDIAVEAIAITATSLPGVNEPISPCGMCRQALTEYENRQGHAIRVILAGETGKVWLLKASGDLLPLQFNRKNLGK
jgi:cytidine deaminase